MTIHHRTVDVEASAKLWNDGLSASQIAKRFGVSRNVIVGLAYRNRDRFPARQKQSLAPVRREPVRKQVPSPSPAPEVEPVPPTAYDAERLTQAKLLHELSAGQCCWPINNGGPYLFCAAETTGRYCSNHRARANEG
ncbi:MULTISPECIES: GcrA family cell cycle regulator [Sinorhizobium]|uniref:GcrA family cell cycle regulator n=1 Tax=Sinorhizobium TaxID=28105 RepID=UPI000BE91192|nr:MULTISPECIES: GcrA family cell cycle regulator [Sinorhizobium]PDT55056.1 GcrA cell cycle regulator [Sinorhizobium sp. NG07B]POH32097.1 GcrA cell cycle regulator [Sinorhizobium americanum]